MNKTKIFGIAILLAISAFTTACGHKKSEPTPDPTPAPEVNGKDPIANDSGLRQPLLASGLSL